jgi:hypothetical protein
MSLNSKNELLAYQRRFEKNDENENRIIKSVISTINNISRMTLGMFLKALTVLTKIS